MAPARHRRRLPDRTAPRSRVSRAPSAVSIVSSAASRRRRSRFASTCTGTCRSPRCQASRARCRQVVAAHFDQRLGPRRRFRPGRRRRARAHRPCAAGSGSGDRNPICVPLTPVRMRALARGADRRRGSRCRAVRAARFCPARRIATRTRHQFSRAGRSSSRRRAGRRPASRRSRRSRPPALAAAPPQPRRPCACSADRRTSRAARQAR